MHLVSRVPLFVINLDRSLDRLENIKKQFPSAIRVPAIDGKKLLKEFESESESESELESNILYKTCALSLLFDLKNRNNIKQGNRDHRLISIDSDSGSVNSIACSLSHAKVLDIIIQNQIPLACVFEDDTSFSNLGLGLGLGLGDPETYLQDFISREIIMKKQRNPTPDIFLLRYEAIHDTLENNKNNKNHGNDIEKDIFLPVHGLFMNTGSFIITLKGAQKLKSLLFPINMHLDMFIGTCANLGKLNVVALKKEFMFLENDPILAKKSLLGHKRKNLMDILSFQFFDNNPSDFIFDPMTREYKQKSNQIKRKFFLKNTCISLLYIFSIGFFILLIILLVSFFISTSFSTSFFRFKNSKKN